ncbi:MAG: polysaccharide pyruvyl transferase family protein [Chloroflexales bacterium]
MPLQQIMMLGAYGQNNLGDDALLEVCLAQLSASRLVVNSAQPEQTRRRYGVDAVATYSAWPRLRRPRALYRSDAIVFGGGSLLKEIEGGTLARLLYFLRIFLVLIFARLLGRPTAMLGVGIGPLKHPLYRWLSRYAANLTDLICVRDRESHDLLVAIGVRRPIYTTADLVFSLGKGDTANAANEPPSAHEPTVVVIPRYSLSAAQVTALAAACDHLAETYGARVQLMPFQTGYVAKYDDLTVTRAVLAQMRHAELAEVLVPETPQAALALIGRADLVLSTRLHGLIFAAIRGVAMVGLDYEVKVRSFMAEIGQAAMSVSLDDLEAGRLPAVLDRAWAQRHAASAAIRDQFSHLRTRSQQNFVHFTELAARPRQSGLIGGGALLLASMTIVNAGNYLFNLVLGRWLGPAAFADLSLMITAFLIVTLITATLQTISAKFAAMYAADGDTARVQLIRAWLGRWAWGLGGATLAVLAIGAPFWQQFFQTTSLWPFVILGLGLPFYYAQGIDRGVLQGATRFTALALSYQVEMWARLIFAVALVALGWSVNGAVAGVTLSLVAAWLAAAWPLGGVPRRPIGPGLRPAERRAIAAFAGPVVAALVGQVLINNSDILIVKHFFPSAEAGHYAALALIGRVVFFATLSVVAAMFPIAAQRHQRGEAHRHLLWLALALVAAASLAVIGAALLFPALMVQLLFGAAYLPIAPLLWLYAAATMFYALANVVINYRLAIGDGGGSALVVAAGMAQVVGLWLFHASLDQVVMVQVILMAVLLAALIGWDGWLARRQRPAPASPRPLSPGPSPTRSEGRFHPWIRRGWRTLLLGGTSLAVRLLRWQIAGAQGSRPGNPAQAQVINIMPALRDSEAEQAAGAYIPGVGAVFSLDLLRGPNAWPNKPAYDGVRDWAVYLLGAFAPKLDAVPPNETIAISVRYYNFTSRDYHQLVISCRAANAADGATYAIWHDGMAVNPRAEQLDQGGK